MAIEFPVLVTAVCFVSWLSWHQYEKHFLKLKSRFEYGGNAGLTPAAA
jgi:hypothetical protein